MENTKSKNKNLILMITSILIVAVIVVLIVMMMKNNNKDLNENNQQTNQTPNEIEYIFPEEKESAESISLDSAIIKQLEDKYNKIKNTSGCGFNFIDEVYANDVLEFAHISSIGKMAILENYADKNYTESGSNPIKEINIQGEHLINGWIMPDDMLVSLKEDYHEVFGSTNDFYLLDTFGTCPTYYYVEGLLIVEDTSSCGCGTLGEIESYEYLVKAEQTESTIRIYKKIGFKLWDYYGKSGLSKDAQGNEILKETISEDANAYFKENQELLNTYMIVYKKDTSGNYYFYYMKKM